MATRQRARDRGRERGMRLRRTIGSEIRLARRSLGLSLAVVAADVQVSVSELSRIERGLATWAALELLAALCEVVGLELSARAYPGGRPLRDSRHAALLGRFRARLHPSLRWLTEVPLPLPGDLRAWDGGVAGPGWFYGVEAEMNPLDGQAVTRRALLKQRDSGVSGVILLLPDTRQARRFRHEFSELMATDFPVSGRRAMELLGAGASPGGSSVVVLSQGDRQKG